MGDLISRSAVMEIIEKHECDTARIKDGIFNLPTAFDVEKVVEQLEDDAFEIDINLFGRMECINKEDAVEIIRKGGIA